MTKYTATAPPPAAQFLHALSLWQQRHGQKFVPKNGHQKQACCQALPWLFVCRVVCILHRRMALGPNVPAKKLCHVWDLCSGPYRSSVQSTGLPYSSCSLFFDQSPRRAKGFTGL